MVVNSILNRFQQKDNTETFQTMEILLLKALREEVFGHKLQQMSSFFSSDLDKFKLETQLRNFIQQVPIKIISSLNAFQKLVVSDVLKLVKLILTGPTTNAVSKSSCSTFV